MTHVSSSEDLSYPMTVTSLLRYLFGSPSVTPITTLCSSTSIAVSSGGTLHVVEILARPRELSESGVRVHGEWQDHLFTRCIPYIAAAFHEEVSSLPEESRRQHYLHLVNGERLFVAVMERGATRGKEVEVEEEEARSVGTEFEACGHCLTTVHDPVPPATCGSLRASLLHIDGMVVSPSVQGAGIGTRLMEASIKSTLAGVSDSETRSVFVSARTQNEAIFKLFHAVGSALRRALGPIAVFPACTAQNEETETLCQVASWVAEQQNAGVPYRASEGVFPRMYPAFLRRVFGGNPDFPVKRSSIAGHRSLHDHMSTEDGDAALLCMRVL